MHKTFATDLSESFLQTSQCTGYVLQKKFIQAVHDAEWYLTPDLTRMFFPSKLLPFGYYIYECKTGQNFIAIQNTL